MRALFRFLRQAPPQAGQFPLRQTRAFALPQRTKCQPTRQHLRPRLSENHDDSDGFSCCPSSTSPISKIEASIHNAIRISKELTDSLVLVLDSSNLSGNMRTGRTSTMG